MRVGLKYEEAVGIINSQADRGYDLRFGSNDAYLETRIIYLRGINRTGCKRVRGTAKQKGIERSR
jgi:hypothetical protein